MNGTNEKIMNLLTMCRKAGKMALGFDSVKESILKRKAELILLASDISPKTEKEIRFFADKNGIPAVKTGSTMEGFGMGIGKKVGVIAVCDKGFAGKTAQLAALTENKADPDKM